MYRYRTSRGFTGIEILIVVMIIGLVSAGGVVVYKKQQAKGHPQASKVITSTSSASLNPVSPTPSPTPSPSVTPTPSPTVVMATPKPTLKPSVVATATPKANITPFTPADCHGASVAYVSNKSGAQVSYMRPEQWAPLKTYAYGEAVSIFCEVGDSDLAPQYGLIDQAFVKTSDLSTTKP
jgi:type II secretory pathway pseudopilin PulG